MRHGDAVTVIVSVVMVIASGDRIKIKQVDPSPVDQGLQDHRDPKSHDPKGRFKITPTMIQPGGDHPSR
ncbi:hypothetical protein [Streptomyces sp. enrichment culture]|uniref:hypothetical protein n=1 Tax=Streptomyces sp. enrichment culture TaxID=1795815 RepID=UPI003F5654E1